MSQQETLDGGSISTKRTTCEYLVGCGRPAEYELDVLIYGEGIVETPACESCTDEFLEFQERSRVRRLRLEERWQGGPS